MLFALLTPALVVLATLSLLQKLFSVLQRLRARRRNRCLPAARLPQSAWRFGADVQALMAQIKTSGHVTRSLQGLFSQHGQTFQATIWRQPWLWTCDPEILKAINTSCFSAFGVEPLRKPVNSGWMGDGIFVSDGERWRASRALFRPLFSQAGSVHLSAFEQQVRTEIDLLPKDGATVDLQGVFRGMYLGVSFAYLFGTSPGALRPGRTASIDVDRFHAAFETATVGMSRRQAMGRAFRWADRGEKQWRQACCYVHAIFDGYIDEAIRTHETDTAGAMEAGTRAKGSEARGSKGSEYPGGDELTSPQHPASMLSSLVQLTQDREFLRNQLLNVFLGAKDTATIGISDVFFHLSRHPDVWRKLRDEVFASSAILSPDPGQFLTFEAVRALPYLQNVLKESLRLLSPVDQMNRVCVRDTVLPRGGGPDGRAPLFVRSGTRIEGRLAPMHRDAHFWGADAEEFVPERWERWERPEGGEDASGRSGARPDGRGDSNGLSSHHPRWEYIPFLGGARMCSARQMTLTQYAVVLVRFAQRFERLENRDLVPEFVEQIKFGKQSANGVLVGLVEGN